MQGPFDTGGKYDKEDFIQMYFKLHLNQVFSIEYNCLDIQLIHLFFFEFALAIC
jgi:hypothetical protein